MQIESLRYFIGLARAGSFNQAAKNSYLSQQGLNKAITTLEAELNVKLIERGRGGIRLTEKGEAFIMYAEQIMASYDEMLTMMFRKDGKTSNLFTEIHAHLTYYPIQILGGLASRSIILDTVNLNEHSFKDILELAKKSNGSELFFVDLYSSAKNIRQEGLVFESVLTTWYGIVCREESAFSSEKVIHRESLRNAPIAVNAFREMNQVLKHVFENQPLENVKMRATSPRMLLSYAQSSLDAVSTFDSFGYFISERDGEMPTEGLKFTPLSTPRARCQIGFLYSKNKLSNPQCRHAINLLKTHLREQYPEYFEMYPL
ncbi:MAG: LysR family transcriptional regulator [Gordonibacter sp.]|nr:LysR family transcriptional regulator [Gordonibacter sp.]